MLHVNHDRFMLFKHIEDKHSGECILFFLSVECCSAYLEQIPCLKQKWLPVINESFETIMYEISIKRRQFTLVEMYLKISALINP